MPNSKFQIPNSKRKSFTLLEILIASALFTGIIVLTIGSFTDSISSGASSTSDRITREAARTFTDYVTRQLRQAGSQAINVACSDTFVQNFGCGSTGVLRPDYYGSGYVLLAYYCGSGCGVDADKMVITDSNYTTMPPSSSKASALIIRLPANTTNDNWLYIGEDPTESGYPNAQNPTYVLMKSVGKGVNHALGKITDMSWALKRQIAAQFMPSEVLLKSLTFSGINPVGVAFDSATGAPNTNGIQTLAQPYVTITLQLAPKSDPSAVSTYQTTITASDMGYAFPKCSTYADPNHQCI